MAMTFTTKPVAAAPAQESFDLCKLDLLNATESLNQAWMDLTDTQREIDGLQEIMDNITQSVELLSKYGAEAIPMLNQDGGLEALLQIPEKLITVEKAQEGLGEAAKSAWEKFKELIVKVWTAVKSWITNMWNKLTSIRLPQIKKAKEDISKADDAVIAKKAEEMLPKSSSTEAYSDVYKTTNDLYSYDDTMAIIAEIKKLAEVFRAEGAALMKNLAEIGMKIASKQIADDTSAKLTDDVVDKYLDANLARLNSTTTYIQIRLGGAGGRDAQFKLEYKKQPKCGGTYKALDWGTKTNIVEFLDSYGRMITDKEIIRSEEAFENLKDALAPFDRIPGDNQYYLYQLARKILAIVREGFRPHVYMTSMFDATYKELLPLLDAVTESEAKGLL